MKIGLSVSIDVTKILKERIHEGAKGKYIDLTTFIDTDAVDQYGNHGFISQSMSKEEREANAPKTPILGNCKVFYKDDSSTAQGYSEGITEANKAAAQPSAANNYTGDFDDSDIPF